MRVAFGSAFRRRFSGLVIASMALMALVMSAGMNAAKAAEGETVTVFAAASLKNALDAASAAYLAETGQKVVVSYAASSALAKQIEHGAPADVFISADLDWMDYLAKAKLIVPDTRRNLLGNRLVIVARSSNTAEFDVKKGFALAEALGADGRLAVGDVQAVPAGKYAKAALENLGVWESVEHRLAQAENVRAALALVARGEAPLGIVYQTDAAAQKDIKIAGVFPESSHPPIIYPIAVLANAPAAKSAGAFVAYLESAAAAPAFQAQGFEVLK